MVLFPIIISIAPRIREARSLVMMNLEHFHNALPHCFTLKRFMDRYGLDVCRAEPMQVFNRPLQPLYFRFIRHCPISTKSLTVFA